MEGPREAERGSYPRRRGFSRCGRNMLALREVWDVAPLLLAFP